MRREVTDEDQDDADSESGEFSSPDSYTPRDAHARIDRADV